MNSPLVVHTNLSPNKTTKRTRAIDTITIHCTAGQVTAEQLGQMFEKKERKASSNYGVDKDGKAPYAVSDAAYASLIYLVADICRRNGIKKLLWKHDKTLVGKTDANGNLVQNMTLHKWFANKACPGAYLEERMFDIAAKVNALL